MQHAGLRGHHKGDSKFENIPSLGDYGPLTNFLRQPKRRRGGPERRGGLTVDIVERIERVKGASPLVSLLFLLFHAKRG